MRIVAPTGGSTNPRNGSSLHNQPERVLRCAGITHVAPRRLLQKVLHLFCNEVRSASGRDAASCVHQLGVLAYVDVKLV